MENSLSIICHNLTAVNDNVMTVYDKLIELAPKDLTPLLAGLTNVCQSLSNQIVLLKNMEDAHAEELGQQTVVLNEILGIVRTIPGITIQEPEVLKSTEVKMTKTMKK